MTPKIQERVLDTLRRAHDLFGPLYRVERGRLMISYPRGLGSWAYDLVPKARLNDCRRAAAAGWLEEAPARRISMAGSRTNTPRFQITEAGVRAIGRWPEEV